MNVQDPSDASTEDSSAGSASGDSSEESSETESEEESEAVSEDESEEESEVVSEVVVSEAVVSEVAVSEAVSEDVSEEPSDIESSKEEPEVSKDEPEVSKEDPKNVLSPGNPIQKTHQTPERLKESAEYTDIIVAQERSPITPIYVVIRDADMALGDDSDYNIIKKSGLKVWICTKDGKKIDYVYTNSEGVAAFETMEGEYTFYFEGTDVYAPKYYHKTVTCYAVYIGRDWTYLGVGSGYRRKRYPIFSYVKENHKDLKIYVTDDETGKPVKGAYVTVQSDGGKYEAYTDANGVATTKSLLAGYDGNPPDGKEVTVTADRYRPSEKRVNVMDNEVHIRLKKMVSHNIKITCVDAATGTPIKGVVAKQMNIERWDKDSRMIISESGDDGVISFVATDYMINNMLGWKALSLTYTDSEGQSFVCEYDLFSSDKENVEFTLKVEKTDSGYVIISMYE